MIMFSYFEFSFLRVLMEGKMPLVRVVKLRFLMSLRYAFCLCDWPMF